MKKRETNPIRKQTSRTEYFQTNGHFILMKRNAEGISLCVVGQNGDGCNGKARFFPYKELRLTISQAREKGNTTITLLIPSQYVKGGVVRTGEEQVPFQCRFLTANMRRPL